MGLKKKTSVQKMINTLDILYSQSKLLIDADESAGRN